MNLIALLVELWLRSFFGKQWRWRPMPSSATHRFRAERDTALLDCTGEFAEAHAARWSLGEGWLTGNRSSSDAVDSAGSPERARAKTHSWQARRSWSG
jgi:hypothetical protein